MKSILILALFFIAVNVGCNNTTSEKMERLISQYVKEKVKNPSSYIPLKYSSIDTTYDELYRDSILIKFKPKYKYKVDHVYEVENSDKQRVQLTVSFRFDSTRKIIGTSPVGLNGDYGRITGNVYWKYNNFVGNKPDAGSEASLYSLDTFRRDVSYKATCDVMGNFEINKILPGDYLLIVRSQNTTDSPDEHLDELLFYSDPLFKLFGYDISNENRDQIGEYGALDSLCHEALMAEDIEYGTFSKRYAEYQKLQKKKMELAEIIIGKFPIEFKSKIGLYSGYSKKLKFHKVTVDEAKTSNEIIDFGITYY
jgi:hypothetical protein